MPKIQFFNKVDIQHTVSRTFQDLQTLKHCGVNDIVSTLYLPFQVKQPGTARDLCAQAGTITCKQDSADTRIFHGCHARSSHTGYRRTGYIELRKYSPSSFFKLIVDSTVFFRHITYLQTRKVHYE